MNFLFGKSFTIVKIFHVLQLNKNSVHPIWDERCCIRGATQVNAFYTKQKSLL